ncbi:MAG: PEP-CTERM sorting domain-containing protein [Alphaproteobacteria bacterium]|nr:PEP-CTERM sorting domain-containing protein [Alphaproteobacteria bacterium]MDP6812580.1 PEP-CTERM sorting domain-containing protein [Alphaproteobacteria bacterium]
MFAASGLMLAAVFAASGAYAAPVILVSHNATASSFAMIHGSSLDLESDTNIGPFDPTVSAISGSSAGPGAGHARADGVAESTYYNTVGDTVVIFDVEAYYFAPTAPPYDNPGGVVNAELDATWTFALATTSVDLTFSNLHNPSTGEVTGTAALTVDNVTSGTSILDLVDPGHDFGTTLHFTGLIGDLIEIGFSGIASGTVPANGGSKSYRDYIQLQFTTAEATPGTPMPEPATVLLLGLALVGMAWHRHRRRG